MIKILTRDDIPLINQRLNEPKMLKAVGMGKEALDISNEFDDMLVLMSGDQLDIALFEKKDLRVYQGHNCFTSKSFTSIRNGKALIKEAFALNPYLEVITGLTPVQYKTTRKFNILIGMKPIKYEWMENGTFAVRYEIRRYE